MSVHIVDPCQVVDVGRIVEQLAGFLRDEVSINHRGKLKEGHTRIWNQSPTKKHWMDHKRSEAGGDGTKVFCVDLITKDKWQ